MLFPLFLGRARRALLLFALLLPVSATWAFDAFQVADIRVEGLRRISAGTVFNYLPVEVGDRVSETVLSRSIQALFQTGFFKDVRAERQGNDLVVIVVERPAIDSIHFTGNKDLEEEALLASLKAQGLAPGEVFNPSTLELIEQGIRNQYFARGKYNASVKVTTTPLERNRVAINIDISEGAGSTIKQIKILGNTVFSDEEILDSFALSDPAWYEFWSSGTKYSKAALTGDIEKLRSRYLDRGYLKFDIESTQVTISEDKKDVFVTLTIHEGPQYKVSSVKLAGDLVLSPERLFPGFYVNKGDVFSRQAVVKTTTALSKELARAGYAFANVNPVPEVDDQERAVALTFFVDPGKRVLVRRIEMRGNTKTRDEVLRREMRQMESTWFNADQVERSRERLEKLAFFDSVDVGLEPVAGTDDAVDVSYTVKEKPSGNFLAGVGYSPTGGIAINTSVTQDNFLGSGKRVSFGVNTSSINTTYRFSFTDPYYTIDGISRGFSFRYRETDAAQANVSNYTTNELGAAVTWGIPVTEFDTIALTADITKTDVNTVSGAANEIVNYLNSNGSSFTNLSVVADWSHDTRDKATFPTKGIFQRIAGEVTTPGSDLTYFSLITENRVLLPLAGKYVLSLGAQISSGAAYGSTTSFPFYKNFYAGGISSVRGYKTNTLGPRDSNNDPFGGAFKTTARAELVMPSPFKQYEDQARTSVFFDIGNVFTGGQQFKTSELRMSTGLGLRWLTPVGPMSFAYGIPLNEKSGDEIESFQFTLGVGF